MTEHITGDDLFIRLYKLNLIPLYVVLPSLVWVLHDYFVTLEDEVTYIWRHQKPGFGRFMFFWIRYYTIFLVVFDVLQIHGFAIPGVPSLDLCLATDPTTRMLGAISLWSVEIIMQLRIYVLYNRSKRVALFNGILFIISIAAFLCIMVINAIERRALILKAVHLPLPGCPVINGNTQWALWIPAMLFEFILFGFAVFKSIVSTAARMKLNKRTTLTGILLHENILYFLVVAALLIFNNLMAIGVTNIPWFGFGPFHAALGITTSRMMIHLQKFAAKNLEGDASEMSSPEIRFVGSPVSNGGNPRPSYDSEAGSDMPYVSDIENTAGKDPIHEYPVMRDMVEPQAGPSRLGTT